MTTSSDDSNLIDASEMAEFHDAATPQTPPIREPRLPRYDWGLPVTAATDLVNDGSFPGVRDGDLLAPKGTPGEIIRVGRVEGSDTPVYLVEFPGGMMIGCLEEEVEPVSRRRERQPGMM